MSLENDQNDLKSPNQNEDSKNSSLELLIELHYQLSDMNIRLSEFDYSFLQQILKLSELEIKRQMASD